MSQYRRIHQPPLLFCKWVLLCKPHYPSKSCVNVCNFHVIWLNALACASNPSSTLLTRLRYSDSGPLVKNDNNNAWLRMDPLVVHTAPGNTRFNDDVSLF
ncbi:hypothetical protein Pelo_5174 [Pelomyxa schiedti]|nr:hypothetical protein Pelo_5174 [Pelomyxa schiedti]